MTYIVWYSSMENDTQLFNSKLTKIGLIVTNQISWRYRYTWYTDHWFQFNRVQFQSNRVHGAKTMEWEKNNNNNKIMIITMMIITIIIIMIIITMITIIIIISRIVLNAYVLNILYPRKPHWNLPKMQHRWTDRRTDIEFHETLKDLDPKDTYTSNFWNPHSHGHAVESIRKCIKVSENRTRFEGFNLKIDFKMPKMPKSHDRPLCPYLMRYDAVIPIKDLDPNNIYAKYHWSPIKTTQVIVRTPNTHERAPRFIKKSARNSAKIQIFKLSKTQDLYHVSPWALQTYQVWRL